MKKLIICLAAFFTLSAAIQAQTVVPFLKKNGKYILVDATSMKPIANVKEFDKANELEGGFWQLCVGENCGLYNKQGKQLLKPKKLIFRDHRLGNLFISFAASDESDPITGLYGLVDTNGIEVVQPKFRFIYRLSEGLINYSTHENKSGFVDQKGKVVIQGIPGSVNDFSDGLARVEKYLPDNSKLYYYVDKTGKTVLKPTMKDVEWYENFNNNRAYFKQKSTDLNGLIDKKGQVIVEAKFQDISYFNNGLAAAKLNNKYGLIDINGNFVVANEYDEFESFEKELVLLKKGEFWGAINLKGKVVIPFKYDKINMHKDGLLIYKNNNDYDLYDNNGQLVFSTKVDEEYYIESIDYGYVTISLEIESLLVSVEGKQFKIPNHKGKATVVKTPNYFEVRFAGGSEFKNYFMSLDGKVYKAK